MEPTLLQGPQQTGLTTVAAARERLKLESPEGADDPALARMIEAASDAIESTCDRAWPRVHVQELVPGQGGIRLMVSRTPVVGLGTVLYQNSPVPDMAIEDALAGVLLRSLGGIMWTPGYIPGLLEPVPAPGAEAPSYAVTYWGGYLLPGEDIASGDLEVVAETRTYAWAGGTFPLLVPGDVLRVSGFAQAVNNGRHTVVARLDAHTIQVAETLADEAPDPAAARVLRVHTLPGDVERACLETVAAWWRAQGRQPEVQDRMLGPMRVTYRKPDAVSGQTLPLAAMALVAPWIRVR